MSDRQRHDASDLPQGVVDRDAKIEQLLLVGLDHYFNGQYEQAIYVWTRVLFLDRGHARARAYIERARGALAERQRESDELVHTGLAAFDRGDVNAARELLTSALERGGPHEQALATLDRLNRLEPAGGPADGVERPRNRRRPMDRPASGSASAHRLRVLPVVFVVAIGTAGLYVATVWDQLAPLLPLPRVTPETTVAPVRADPVPVVSVGEMALARARLLFERGRLHEALRLLEEVRPGDPLRPEADELRAAIQRALLAGTSPSPSATGGNPGQQ